MRPCACAAQLLGAGVGCVGRTTSSDVTSYHRGMDEIQLDNQRSEALNRVDWCEPRLGDDFEETKWLVDRNLELAKTKALISISGELALIRKALSERQI
ncbi:Uncharacterised protein [Mycobacteroides abscessus]|nr:Uncharacterised protein [Mycobacteroides abscessus]CPS03403.1 Uncharacterised protein [Mycobacteroides abscessus]CPT04230.1 Uncharacterised protein [Mycobacteroides abscessus]CPU33440.1 Uncharacterised protein [Mycobacteroides abscessus]CPV12009.1 Uncharacterised protein [Mycobacteroides abscessus]